MCDVCNKTDWFTLTLLFQLIIMQIVLIHVRFNYIMITVWIQMNKNTLFDWKSFYSSYSAPKRMYRFFMFLAFILNTPSWIRQTLFVILWTLVQCCHHCFWVCEKKKEDFENFAAKKNSTFYRIFYLSFWQKNEQSHFNCRIHWIFIDITEHASKKCQELFIFKGCISLINNTATMT